MDTFRGVAVRRTEIDGARGVDVEGARRCDGLMDGVAVGGATAIIGVGNVAGSREVEANAFDGGGAGNDVGGAGTVAIDAGTNGILNGESDGSLLAKGELGNAGGSIGGGAS